MDQRVEAVCALALVGKARHQQDRELRMIARGRQRERNAVHDRHADIGEQELECAPLARQQIERLGAVVRGRHAVTVHDERTRDEAAQRLFVLGDQNPCHGTLTRCRSLNPGQSVAAVEEAHQHVVRFRRRRSESRSEGQRFPRRQYAAARQRGPGVDLLAGSIANRET